MITIRHRFTQEAILEVESLSYADLKGADLYGANLTGADLTDADLTRADIRGANLTGVYLTRADLTDANIISTRGIYTIQLDRDVVIAHASQVQIGCEKHIIDQWLEHYKEIGKKNGYTEKQIEIYGKQLELIKLMLVE